MTPNPQPPPVGPASFLSRLAFASAALLVAALPASAEVVLMRTGSRIACSRAVPEGSRLRLELPGGGQLHVALADVKRIDPGSTVPSRDPFVRKSTSSGSGSDDALVARSSGIQVDPMDRGRTLDQPVDPEVTYQRAAAAGKAPSFPTVVGAMAGVEPVPGSPQLREGETAPELDARRRGFAQRARISPGSASGLLSRGMPGQGRGATVAEGGREVPRVSR